ncbi:MAG: hypothetical protein AAFR52_08240 [Pseudomonadota bacterium]
MFSKIAVTALIIAIVFMVGRASALARRGGGAAGRVARRGGTVARGRFRRPRAADPAPPAEDLLECPHCSRFHAATEMCPCRRSTDRK